MKSPSALCLAVLAACGVQRASPPQGPVEWVADALPAKDVMVNGLDGSGPRDVWAVGSGIFHFDGERWFDATPPDLKGYGTALNAVAVVARDDVWAVGVNGRLAHFDGTTWRAEQLVAARVSHDPHIRGHFDLIDVEAWPGEVWVTTAAKDYLRFDGKAWSKVPVPLGRSVQQLWGSSPKDVWLPGGRVARFDGTRWDDSVVLPVSLREVHGSAPNDVWLVGWEGGHKDDVGATFHFDGRGFTRKGLPDGTTLLWAVHSAGPREAYAVGRAGWAVAWDGTRWRPSPTGTSKLLRAVYSPGGGVAFAAGDLVSTVLRRRPPRAIR